MKPTVLGFSFADRQLPPSAFLIGNLFLVLSTVLIFMGHASDVHAQSALDGFDPNANGAVSVLATQADGKILLGGNFTTLSPNGGAAVARNRIARLNSDGTLDNAFDPNANGSVQTIVVQTDGKIVVGGSFTVIGAQTRNRLARLNMDGTVDLAFNPNPNNTVFALALQTDGKIVVGGIFTSIGGQTRNNIGRLDPVTGLADAFNPNANNQITSIALQLDGKVIAGGQFTSIGGTTRNRIARLDASSGLADSWNPNANSTVTSIAVQADGKILAGGFFQAGFGTPTIGGATRNRIARLDPVTGLADSWNPNANNFVRVVAVQHDGRILVGGDFTGANSIGGANRNNIARIDPATGLADSFDPHANSLTVFAIAQQADGKVLAGGVFTALTPNGGMTVTRNRIARLETDGRVDQMLNLNLIGSQVRAIAVQPDGKILIGGIFSNVLGVARSDIARINNDGTLDTLFHPVGAGRVDSIVVQPDGKILVGGLFQVSPQGFRYLMRLEPTGDLDFFEPNPSFIVYTIALQTDGKILIGGSFGMVGEQIRNYIARLNSDGSLDTTFNPDANGRVDVIAVQKDGMILAGGLFTAVGGQPRNHIARLDPTTGLADSFDPNANDEVTSIALQPDGKIIVGGTFLGANSIGGEIRNFIARLDPITGLADSFDPNADNAVSSMAIQADSKILVGGDFSVIGGQSRIGIARLDPVTGLADSFDPNPGASVTAITLQTDGKVLAGGSFSSVGGQARNRFARLTNDTSALEALTVTQNAVTWARDGSSPQFCRVTFAFSTDNVNYVALGDGTASGNDWIRTGLNLPIQHNLYVRARGHSRAGYQSSSESITETERNAFLLPTPTPTPTMTPTPTPPAVNLSGAIVYCSNPALPPVPDATLSVTGSISSSTDTDASGNYTISSLPAGGNYTVTPTKLALAPGSVGISTVDVIAIQRHFLNLGTPLAGCRLTAADVNGDTAVSTIDVVATQRFFLGLSSGIANAGKYRFSPANRVYTGIVSDQTGQNYDALVFGDVASSYVH